MDNKYKKGSEWRKWDLQVQPIEYTWLKDSKKHKDKISRTAIEYLEKAVSKKIKVLAITDHNCGYAIDEALKIKEEKDWDIEILPGIEIETPEGWHIIIIFNPLYKEQVECGSWQETIVAFLRKIGQLETIFDKDGGYRQVSIETRKLLKDIYRNKVGIPIFAHCDSSKGFFKRGSNSTRKGIINDYLKGEYYFAIDTKTKTVVEIEEEIRNILNNRKYDLNIPVISSSDAHQAKEVGLKYTWIKSDPTFEGLKQIIYEPKERVRIQKNNPEYEEDKPYFDSIEISEDVKVYKDDELQLKKSNIPLNKNLVTIIGGRGEGKSTLINYMAHILGMALNSSGRKEGDNQELTEDVNFKVEYHKINAPKVKEEDRIFFNGEDIENNELNYVFIEQGSLKNKSIDNQALSNKIKDMLKIKDPNFKKELSEKIFNINKSIEEIEEWKNETDEDGEKINSPQFHKKIIDTNTKLLNNLKNSKNKEKIEEYNDNLVEISKYRNIKEVGELILEKVEEFESEIESIIGQDNENFQGLDLKAYKKEIGNVVETSNTKIKGKENENKKIKIALSNEGISGDLENLLDNATKYQSMIDNSRKELIKIETKEDRLLNLKGKRSKLGTKIKSEYQRQANEVNNAWNELLNKSPDEQRELIKDILLEGDKVKVEGNIIFDKDQFYKMLSEAVHKNTYKDIDDLEKKFCITDLDSWIKYIEENFNSYYDKTIYKKDEFLKLFFFLEKRSKYLRTEAEIKYEGKPLSKLSAGQKGTAYLRIQLANEAFSVPLIFDQPEDDLDNKFIVDELIEIFKKLKKYRQIVIVTHNANLVVNTDAEQVIVAENENEELSYTCGSLENTEIQESVCEILEGGRVAFEQRKNRYNIK
jgi:energy-coupling factor transporter ATP-binding protein EcfA2